MSSLARKRQNITDFLHDNGVVKCSVEITEEPECITIIVEKKFIQKVYDLFPQHERKSFFCFTVKSSNFKLAPRRRGRKKSNQGEDL